MAKADAYDRPTGLNESGTFASSVNVFLTRTLEYIHRRFTIPTDVLSRAGLLFAVLCALKVAMLIALRKHLFETYWRVGPPVFDWLNHAAFFLFAFLVGATLWNLGRQYENKGARTVRSANLFVLILGALFVFLSFHEGNRNYLHPVMNDILGWGGLLPYLSLNCFFRPPFLAVWCVAYAVTYYWLVRTGRERFILRATAIYAAAYTVFCLRDLIVYREELVVADALGMAYLVFLRRANAPLNLLWVFLPVVFLTGMYLAIWRYSELLWAARPECIVLVGGTLILVAGASLLAWRRGLYSRWSWLVPFAGISFLLLANTNYPASDNYRNLMCLALTLPRYFIGEFLLVSVLLLVAAGYRRWRPEGSLLWLDAINIVLIALALIDLRLTQLMAARLDWDLLSLALGEGPKMIWRMARPYLPVAAAVLAGFIFIYAFALHALNRLSRRPRISNGFRQLNLGYATVVCILLGLVGRWTLGNDKALGQTIGVLAQTSVLWQNTAGLVMNENQFRESIRQLGMEQFSAARTTQASDRPPTEMNVVFVLQESSYNKHLSLFSGDRETQPLLSRYKERMELFPNFFSSFAGSINARFACFTGMYPVRDYNQFTLRRIDAKSLFEVLHEKGYATSVFYSSYFDYTGFRDYLRGRDVDGMFDADTMPGERKTKQVSWGLREEETLGAMQNQIKQFASTRQKFFMTYIPAAPHNPYDGTPERFRKYQRQKFRDFTQDYCNEMLYMDWIITSIVDQLKESGLLDKTLVVITSDHGEMLGEDGGPIGHGWALTPELANVPLIIMNPDKRGYSINQTVGSQVDLLPTILDILGISCPANQLYQGVSLHSTNAQTDRVIYLNSFGQYAVIQGRNIFVGDRTEKPSDSRIKAFTMQNKGARTTFLESQTQPSLPCSIGDFDAFQENLLRNYAHYRNLVHPLNTALSSSSR